jgi:serine/threonine-protein kinase
MPVLGHRRHFGRYQLLYRFATGGMAEVFLGRLSGEDGFERLVALKIIHEHLSRQPEFVKMFIDEARLASRITHPNVAMTLDLGRVGTTHFIAMEYVDGESLAALVRRIRSPMRYAARIIADSAAGLHAAHELCSKDGQLLGVVHRDVSPQNLLISYAGTVKMVDFGVARARGSLHTTSGEVKGKFGYMSPEQLTDPSRVDRRTDVFALGIILYEVTTWKRLFKGSTESDTISYVLHREIVPPSAMVKDYPPQLEQIVMRALERDLGKRYPTAHALQADLEKYIAATGEPVLQADIGKMMSAAFENRIREKKTLLHNAERDLEGSVPDAKIVSQATKSLVLATVPSLISAKRRARRKRVAVAASTAIALLGGAALAYYFLLGPGRRGPDRPAATTRRDAAAGPRMVTLAATVKPANATILLDGKPMQSPLSLTRRSSDGFSDLVVSAPGYRTQQLKVPLSRDWSLSVELEPEQRELAKQDEKKPEKNKGKKPGGRKGAKKGGKAAGEEDLLADPYAEKKKKKDKKKKSGDEDLLADPYRKQ